MAFIGSTWAYAGVGSILKTNELQLQKENTINANPLPKMLNLTQFFLASSL